MITSNMWYTMSMFLLPRFVQDSLRFLFCHTKTGYLHVCPGAHLYLYRTYNLLLFLPSRVFWRGVITTPLVTTTIPSRYRARYYKTLTSNTRRRNLASELLLQSTSTAPVGITTCVLHISSFLYYLDIFTNRFTAANNDDETKLGNRNRDKVVFFSSFKLLASSACSTPLMTGLART